MAAMTLVLGGTKSGKSSYAQARAESVQQKTLETKQGASQVLYIATARILDDEMADRVQKHIADRPKHWKTWEKSSDLSDGIVQEAEGCCVVILDCLTMLATNIILDQDEGISRDAVQQAVLDEVEQILHISKNIGAEIFIISNLVEPGLVSPNKLGRLFQDISGICHQRIAAQADHVVLMTAGIPQQLK